MIVQLLMVYNDLSKYMKYHNEYSGIIFYSFEILFCYLVRSLSYTHSTIQVLNKYS